MKKILFTKDCGCEIITTDIPALTDNRLVFYDIQYCPIHSAAPEMHDLLMEWKRVSFFETQEEEEYWADKFLARVEAVLAKVEPKECVE